MEVAEAEFIVQAGEAVLNITWQGQNGNLPNPILMDSPDAEIFRWATEAVQTGIRGIDPDPNVNFQDFKVERIAAKDGLPPRVLLRGKTEFG